MSDGAQLQMLPLAAIVPNPNQPRKHFDERSLVELSRSIREQGVLQPLIVRPHPTQKEKYELVAGERRWRALQKAGDTEAPVLIRRLNDQEALEIALLENIQRENLTPLEEARCYQELLQQHDYTQDALAQRLGKDRSTIANMVRLLQLPHALQQDVETGRLSMGHARALLGLADPELQLELRAKLHRYNWSVRETEKQVRDRLLALERETLTLREQAAPDSVQAQLRHLEEELQRHLGTKVKIEHREGKGTLRIEYFSLEEFERLYALLTET